MRLVAAVHTREVRAGLFIALIGLDAVTMVAVATSTAELETYCRTFEPDVVIFERGLPGRTAAEILIDLRQLLPDGRIQIIDGTSGAMEQGVAQAEIFTDLDRLIAG